MSMLDITDSDSGWIPVRRKTRKMPNNGTECETACVNKIHARLEK
jgi:hypothetical protein